MSVYRRDKGTGPWKVDIEYVHPDGRKQRVRKSSKKWTHRDAKRWERKILDQLESGTYGKRKEVPTLRGFEDEFIRNYAEAEGNSLNEIKSKRTHFRLHLNPAMGKKRLDEIDERVISKFKRDKQDEEYNPSTINNMLQTLRKALITAIDWKIISHLPKIKKLTELEPVWDFLDFPELDALLRAAEPEWYPMIMVASKCGLRPGETHGLRWDDVDLERRFLQVKRSIDRGGNIKAPKTNRSRMIPLCDDVFETLKMHQRNRSGLWVFCDEQGGPLRDNKCKHPLKRACNKAGLRQISWYALRHTFASQLVMKGAPLVSVQELMGHSTITMTMRYAHLTPGAKLDAVQLLNSGQSCGTIAAQPESRMAK